MNEFLIDAQSLDNEFFVQGKLASFAQFVQQHETAVFTFCYRMMGHATIAETIAECAFCDNCLLFPTVSVLDVLAAARRRCREQIRRGDYVVETAVTDIQFFFNNLPLPERETLALRYGCNLNFDEIARILETTCEAVRATLHRGRWRIAGLTQSRPCNPN